jgi:hypothetical protein
LILVGLWAEHIASFYNLLLETVDPIVRYQRLGHFGYLRKLCWLWFLGNQISLDGVTGFWDLGFWGFWEKRFDLNVEKNRLKAYF